MAGLFVVLVISLSLKIWKSKSSFLNLSNFLSVTSLAMFCLITFNFASSHHQDVVSRLNAYIEKSNQTKSTLFASASVEPVKEISKESLPDIYYIILDMYPSNVTFKKHFNFDNTAFINTLEKKGFYVAKDSYSNYPVTHLSLSSSLNMDYINEEANGLVTTDMRLYYKLISSPKVVNEVRKHGYQFISFSSGWHLTEALGNRADHLINYSFIPLNPFYDSIIKMTLLRPFAYDLYKQQRYSFDALAQLPKLKSPKFVFLHMYAPHPPFRFDKNGNKRDFHEHENIDSKEAFVDVVTYINRKTEEAVNLIIKNSSREPIIIIQGDHGTGIPENAGPGDTNLVIDKNSVEDMQARYGILNAYYVPDKVKGKLYPQVSPVNSFRIIFNELWKESYPILEDKSYFMWWEDPTNNFVDVTDKVHLEKNVASLNN